MAVWPASKAKCVALSARRLTLPCVDDEFSSMGCNNFSQVVSFLYLKPETMVMRSATLLVLTPSPEEN